MKEFVEKLIKTFKCEELRTELIAVGDVISIINQLAEEFASDMNVGSKAEQIADDLNNVLKEAKAMGCKEVKCFHHIPLENVEVVIKALRAYNQDSTKKKQGWIPCSESLPEEKGEYLITTGFGVTSALYFPKSKKMGRHHRTIF